jgi:hypothetical protein
MSEFVARQDESFFVQQAYFFGANDRRGAHVIVRV